MDNVWKPYADTCTEKGISNVDPGQYYSHHPPEMTVIINMVFRKLTDVSPMRVKIS